jgi:hypothetical protein
VCGVYSTISPLAPFGSSAIKREFYSKPGGIEKKEEEEEGG